MITADSDFISDLSEEEEESSEEEIEVDNEEHSSNLKRCRTRTGLCRRIRARGGQNRKNNFVRENFENRWKIEDKDPVVPTFSGELGRNIDFPDNFNESDVSKYFITDDLIDYITNKTNKYTVQHLRPHALARSWEDVTTIEMKKVFTPCLLMGVVQKPQLHLYWSQYPLFKASLFNEVMSDHDRLYKVHAVIEYIVDRFKSVYVPDEFVCIDEELLLWKDRLSFKQYIPNKRSRFSIKLFSLCETSGYLWNSFVYLGSKGIITDERTAMEKLLGKSAAVVPNLLSFFSGKRL